MHSIWPMYCFTNTNKMYDKILWCKYAASIFFIMNGAIIGIANFAMQ